MKESNKYAQGSWLTETIDNRAKIFTAFTRLSPNMKKDVINKLQELFDPNDYTYARPSDYAGKGYPIELRANINNKWGDSGYTPIYIYADQIDQVIDELMKLKAELF